MTIASPVFGDIVFSGTGRDLTEDPRVRFPIRPYELIGDSIFFDSFGNQSSIAISIPIAPAGTYGANSILEVSFQANLTRPELDHDPHFGVLSGEDARAMGYIDNEGGSVTAMRFVFVNDVVVSGGGFRIFENAGFPNVGESFVVAGSFALSLDNTDYFAELGTKSGSFVRDGIDLSNDLSFFVYPPSFAEEIYLNTLHVETRLRVIPEPNSLSILGLVGIAFLVRRYK